MTLLRNQTDGHAHTDHAHGEQNGHDHSHHDHEALDAHVREGHHHEHADGHACAGHHHGHAHEHAEQECCTPFPSAENATLRAGPGQQLTRLRIGQMDCPTEETLIRRKLDKLSGVHEVHFNLMQRILTVVHDDGALDPVVAAIKSLDMTPEVLSDKDADGPAPQEAPSSRTGILLAVGGVLAALSEAAHFASLPVAISAVLAVAAILTCGLGTYRKGWIALRNGNLNINALMSIAVTGAVLIGQWPEAAMVMVLFNIAELIEARALDRARNAVRDLLALTPQTATTRQPDGSWKTVPVSELRIEDWVRVRPGERIAADGVIAEGTSAIDQSAITGESLPVDKTVGDVVYAGTVNTTGAFDYRVTAASGDSTLARIIHAVEQAQGARAPTQRFIDRFSRVYTPVVVLVAVLVAVVPPLLWGQSWMDAIYRALALLIIACPCALVISTPVTVVSGLTAAARRGILIKGGIYLEQGRKLTWLALDKTGTLTHGKPVCTDFTDGLAADGGSSLDDALNAPAALLAAALAARSDHPVSKAVAQAYTAGRANVGLPEVQDFAALPGRGVRGRVDEQQLHLGNLRLMRELGVDTPALKAQIEGYEAEGKTAIALTDGARILAVAAVADTLKASTREAITDLHRLGVRTLMLTGDNNRAARAIAEQAGIDEAHGELLPEDKQRAVEEKLSDRDQVGMVGDGINDAPALARADIGFAMGAAGTGTAIETADVALMDDDLRKIAQFVGLSRATHRVLMQNIGLALGIKAVFLALAITGHATLWMAVFADVGASLLVVANGLRLLRIR
ncbi:heavy metal translocating P-type ATPase [Bordetella sp. 02P26C-1]|uniref:heavy metal translocating P-type ATPase n=1 Tax=Bordetella sp. 02P26C-1 TaxID=2683195 RepID=UPI0013553EDA|nr:heavy metal translocating P-type ATPase [Bordetella sp. 02P26C-1]MVW80148.1 heavy metal translocating P-type ATPase [Bordetella sp. 02P26C-1]